MTRGGMLMVLFALAAGWPVAAGAQSDSQARQAISSMQKWLYRTQDESTGSWDDRYSQSNVGTGPTALAVLALLSSGEPYQHPQIMKALTHLQRHQPQSTYEAAVRAHVWAQLPDRYLPELRKEAQWLSTAARGDGTYGYRARADTADHSNTHFALLGKWQAARREVTFDSDRALWMKAAVHWMNVQQPDGGWSYQIPGPSATVRSTGSMTCAGLSTLLAAQQALYRNQPSPDPQIDRALSRGLAWMHKSFHGADNPGRGSWTWYYLYALERVALASGWRQLNGEDWFRVGARQLLKEIDRSGDAADGSIEGSLPNTCFALMFLARGRVPVWAGKLHVPGQATNNRPNDLYYLTDYLSEMLEREHNWQSVRIDESPRVWLTAPVTFITGGDAIRFTDAQEKRLKQYLDLGGLLLCLPEQEGDAFAASMRERFERLYPELRFRPADADHPIYNALHALAADHRRQQPMLTLRNGARDLVLIAQRDLSAVWQMDREHRDTPAWRLGANLFAWTSERGTLPGRLATHVNSRSDRGRRGTIRVARPVSSAIADGRIIEPEGWTRLSTHLFNRVGYSITYVDQLDGRPLAVRDLAAFDGPLAHLAARDAAELSEAEIAAALAYVRRGGTVLVETLGGKGDFAQSIVKQLTGPLRQAPTSLLSSGPIMTGKGLRGGQSLVRIYFRPYTLRTAAYEPHRLRLTAVYLADERSGTRPGILFSHDDLTLAAMGIRRDGISGYTTDAARDILGNILLHAAQLREPGGTRRNRTQEPVPGGTTP